jgi:phosphate transport system substrate-binding protein
MAGTRNSLEETMRSLMFVMGLVLGWPAMGGAGEADRIFIRGSNTFGEELGPRLIEVYRRLHPEVGITIESKGTATGFIALLSGDCDIASASRPATEDEERLARSRGLTLEHHVIGYYGVAIIVNAENSIRALTDTQVANIFAGKITNWKPLAGVAETINVYIRDPSSGTHIGFQELVMSARPYAGSAKSFKSYQQIAEAVGRDRWGIGYVGMNLATSERVQPVSVNHELPSALAVNDGVYPYARQLRLYTIKGKASPATQEFIKFVLSRRGQQVLDVTGFVPPIAAPVWPPPPQ